MLIKLYKRFLRNRLKKKLYTLYTERAKIVFALTDLEGKTKEDISLSRPMLKAPTDYESGIACLRKASEARMHLDTELPKLVSMEAKIRQIDDEISTTERLLEMIWHGVAVHF